ncbi:MAG: hypothetical protein WA957_11060 [Alteraurantiacibacter sp.]
MFDVTLMAFLSVSGSMAFTQLDYVADTRETVEMSAPMVERTEPSAQTETETVVFMPPHPTERNNQLSPLIRARDVMDIEKHPVTSFAKMFILDDAGERTESACTAQFVASDILITAAHCVFSPGSKTYNSGFEISIRYDDGESPVEPAPVIRAWVLNEAISDFNTTDLEACDDIALLQIGGNTEKNNSWLGMASVNNDWFGENMVHNFSYPHRSGAAKLTEMRNQQLTANLPADRRDAIIAALDKKIEQFSANEPQFSQSDLYYQFGNTDSVADQYFTFNQSYSLGGRSGSAYIDQAGHIIGLVSRNVDNKATICRLTPDMIGSISTIVQMR